MMKARAAGVKVWWDINRCPVPDDVDVGRVGPCIRRALEKLGYCGPFNITAIGILTDVPHDFLRQVYSSGMAIHHIPLDITEVTGALIYWSWTHPPPANIMLISNESIFSNILDTLCRIGYNVVRSILPDGSQQGAASTSTSPEYLLWESILASLRADAMDAWALQGDNCGSETAEPALRCQQCIISVQSFEKFTTHGFENFTTHLQSREHAHNAQYYCNIDEEKKKPKRGKRRKKRYRS
ncbi:hypothetical protein CARUB_v10010155mg [Capsella rubella]|uniref:NYN domain-containing protein n=1 Tax=Capsella rubella TaxID=81985 RepID=R0IJE7_9BRAS|nr:uncharacterized protein LOC17898963 [Capsella rubella]EOA37053.1 hypothetical protein CARUB_v10010155mg [Capsella rubella]